MSDPKAADPPLTTARSGEIAGLNTYSELLVAVPDWYRLLAATLISYQRTCAPAPPATELEVQSAVPPPRSGSTAVTACIRRPSSVSSRNEVPDCGAFGGT